VSGGLDLHHLRNRRQRLLAVISVRRLAPWVAACLALAADARAQGRATCQSDEIERADDEPVRPVNPMRGSSFLFEQSLSTQAAHLEPSPQQSYVPFYGWWMSLRPCWHLGDHAWLQGRIDYTKEFTNSTQTTDLHEDVFDDIWTDVVFDGRLAKEGPWKHTRLNGGLRALWPTSKHSQAAGTYVTLGAFGGVVQEIPVLGEDARVLNSIWVQARFRYLHPFTNATTPTSYGNFSYTRENVDGFSFVSDQVSGQTLVNHELWAMLDTGVEITPKLELELSFIWIDQWHYIPPAASVGTLTGQVNVPRNGDQQFTQMLWDTIALTYSPVDEVSFSLGYYNLTNAISPDGQLRSPFAGGQDSFFWSPDARVFFDVVARLDTIYEDMAGRRKFGESDLGRAAYPRSVAAGPRVPGAEAR
jgi:hypothetical protein